MSHDHQNQHTVIGLALVMLVLFAYVVLVGLWDLVLLNCHRPELPSGEQQSRKGPSDLFISDITILHSGAGAWSKQRTEQQRQASTFTAALTFTQPSSSLVTGATLGQLEPNGDEGSRAVCGGHMMCVNAASEC